MHHVVLVLCADVLGGINKMEKCVSTYISAQYCTTTPCSLTPGGNDDQTLYRVEYADSTNHAPCSVRFICRCS